METFKPDLRKILFVALFPVIAVLLTYLYLINKNTSLHSFWGDCFLICVGAIYVYYTFKLRHIIVQIDDSFIQLQEINNNVIRLEKDKISYITFRKVNGQKLLKILCNGKHYLVFLSFMKRHEELIKVLEDKYKGIYSFKTNFMDKISNWM